MSDTTKGCETCQYFVREDYGYSNWTTEGTNGDCLLSLNSLLPADLDAWGDKKSLTERALAFGETCASRVEGEGPWFDCDGGVTNESYKDRPVIYQLLLKRSEKPNE